ncbi:MAG: hypothetical protein ACMUEM_07715 [Flavobacteriales bacterium AspAUS03]
MRIPYFDNRNQLLIDPVSRASLAKTLPLKNNPVGSSTQLTNALGFSLQLNKNLSIDTTWHYFDRLYSNH